MAEFSEILFETPEPHIARVTLNRPAQMNAYTTRLCEELVEAIEIYLRDDELRCLILTGAGRGFCSGGDISGADDHHAELMALQLSHGREMRDGMHRVILALSRLDKPTIAMVNGPAVAGGLTLALACDLRIAADTAKLGDTSGRFGLLPDEGGAWLFPRFMGLDLALKMTMLAEVYSALEAEDLGLVTEVVPAAGLEARVMELAREFALRAPLAVRLAKSMMMRGQGMTLEQSLGDAALSVMIANPSADVREGVKAFFDKRMPKFKGK
ncbi:MAG: enoyl-CoA hydratase-related protein [Parvibaculum sp.]|uniref:enoyl-CoA hydratase/isomerase family protein n=1 Tax=Parvibaculum sp. TaxID=2024848 RepID=UPI0027166C29|nr:enoyl-CoA hydratase-related protein [Parvibaculum sp.]MDO8838627.1 enoyl-CoA hydratase-related protein [Parvibaculum sp.]